VKFSLGRSPAVRGQHAARRVVRERPQRLGPSGVDLGGLAEDLGVRIVARRNLGVLARWHRLRRATPTEPRLWEEEPDEADVVHLRSNAQTSARRFAIAHELGHAVLDREFDGRSTELPVGDQERFATAFAAELLLPQSLARSLRSRFREAPDVLSVLHLAQSVGAPPRVLLVRASRENWLVGLDVVWLDIRTLPNPATGRDMRPRLRDYVRDRTRWWLPPNRSVRGLFGDDGWLVRADREMAMSGSIDISRRRGSPAKWVHEWVPAEVAAFRMRTPGPGHGAEVLARVQLKPRDG
jgi:IrrE N-terminal-like domain